MSALRIGGDLYKPGITFSVSNTKLIQVDLDGFEIGKNYPVEVGILGDAKAVLGAILAKLKAKGQRRDYKSTGQFTELEQRKVEWDEFLLPLRTANVRPMTASQVLVEARKALPRDTIVVTDSSNPQNQVFQRVPGLWPAPAHHPGGM